MSLLKAALGFVATAYMNDAVVKPRSTGKLARSYCDRVRKPLLLIRGESMADVLTGSPVKADVTTRRAYPLPYREGTFGAVVAVNVIQCLKRPDLALCEWRRVADKVFVVSPSWWSPHAWLDPSNRWLVHPELKSVTPLWTGRRRAYLLPVSDKGYGTRRWSPTRPSPAPPPMSLPPSPPAPSPSFDEFPPSASPSPNPTPFDSALPPSPTSQPSEETLPLPSLYEDTLPALSPDLPDLDDLGPGETAFQPGSHPGSLSGLPRALTVVSTPESGSG